MRQSPALLPERALISVHDKAGLVPLCRGLDALGVELVASAGTAESLVRVGLPVTSIEALTGTPQALGGRVKSLHPKLYAGILADRRRESHMQELAAMGAVPIDLVICNLYPFAARWASGESRATLIEHIDVGGTTLLRAAAKNMDAGVLVVCDVADYGHLLDALRHKAHTALHLRTELAAKAFRKVAEYDLAIASWCESPKSHAPRTALPEVLGGFIKRQALRYGDNPTQAAALYRVAGESGTASGQRLAGPEPTYQTLLDIDAGCRMVHLAARPSVALIKHQSLCGLMQASPTTPHADVLALALGTQPEACPGAIAACNTEVDEGFVARIVQAGLRLRAITAPGFSARAVQAAQAVPGMVLWQMTQGDPAPGFVAHRIGGGLVLQHPPNLHFDIPSFRQVSQASLPESQHESLKLALQAAWLQRSNAIILVKDGQAVGASSGHVSRADATAHALRHAGARARGAVLASDGAFKDARLIQDIIDAGVTAIVQPGGAEADRECTTLCDADEVCMFLTGQRLLRH